MYRNILFSILFFVFLFITIISFILDADMFRFPMMLMMIIIAALWLFKPKNESHMEGKASFYALITYGIISVLISYVLYIIIPIYGQQWGVEYNPNDAGGVVYPIVNDGHENCIFTSVIFLIYFGIVGFMRIKSKINR